MTPDHDPGGDRAARPLRRDAERNRQRLLDAAREVFAARGVDVTLDDIARHAGLSVGALYRHFPGREELVEALFDTKLDEIADWAEQARHDPDAWAGLTGFLQRTTSAMAADRGLRDVLFSRTYGHDRVERARERLAPAIDALVARCQRDGAVRADLTGADIALVQFMIAALIEYTEPVDPDLWPRYLALVLDGLRHEGATRTSLPHPAPAAQNVSDVARHWKPQRRRRPD